MKKTYFTCIAEILETSEADLLTLSVGTQGGIDDGIFADFEDKWL